MVGEEERVGVLVGVCVCVVGFIMVDGVEQLIIILINCEYNYLSNFQFQFQKRKLNASTVLFVHSTELTYNIE